MRACYIQDLDQLINNTIEFCINDSQRYHYFCRVLMMKKGDEVLFLNGSGLSLIARVKNIDKRKIDFVLVNRPVDHQDLRPEVRVGLCYVKKDQLINALRSSVEFGVKYVTLIRSHYSDHKKWDIEKLKHYLVEGLEQSNNPFLPDLSLMDFENYLDLHRKVVVLHHEKELEVRAWAKEEVRMKNASINLLIGPEGGFSKEEVDKISKKEYLSLTFGSYILRTQTALNSALAVIFQK